MAPAPNGRVAVGGGGGQSIAFRGWVRQLVLRTAHSAASRLNRARDPIELAPAAARVTPEDIGDREQALARLLRLSVFLL